MRAAGVDARFGMAEVAVRERPVPTPGEGEVLVRVRAASLNYRDYLVATGQYNPSFTLPLTLGSDAVGEIVEIGRNSEGAGLSLGARVCPLMVQGWLSGPPKRDTVRQSLGGPLQGVFADYVVVRADSVVKIPDGLSDEEAACLPCAALTAWSALVTLSSVEAGDSVLTIGTGGVSIFALQLARSLGARVFATTRDPNKRERLLQLGAQAVVDPRSAGWGDEVRKLSGGEGVAHVVELGGAATLEQSLRAVRPGGTISLIGRFGHREAAPSLLPVVMRAIKLQGVYVGHKQSFESMLAAFTKADVRPVIDSVYPLERTADALERMLSGHHFGKICLKVS